jgi:hypothetical protein
VRERFGGHWPRHAYQLNMPAPGETGEQTTSLPSAVREPDETVDKPHELRLGHAAPNPSTEPQALRQEYPNNIQIEYPPEPPAPLSLERRKAAKRTRAVRQDLQNRIVSKLGNGDIEVGWSVFDLLTGFQRQTLEDLEADGRLGPEEIIAVTRQAMGPPP